MKRQSRQRLPRAQRIAIQRTLSYLAAVRPGVPLPIHLLEEIVGGDLMLESSELTSIADILTSAPSLVQAGLSTLYEITVQDAGRAVVTVSAEQQAGIAQALREVGRSKAQRGGLLPEDPLVTLIVELHMIAALNAEEFSQDHLALIAAHGLFWLEQALASNSSSGVYGAVQALDALLMLYEQEVIALSEFAQVVPRVIEQAERHGPGWQEWMPCSFLVSVAEGLVSSGEPELLPSGERAFALAERFADGLTKDERKMIVTEIKHARKRLRA